MRTIFTAWFAVEVLSLETRWSRKLRISRGLIALMSRLARLPNELIKETIAVLYLTPVATAVSRILLAVHDLKNSCTEDPGSISRAFRIA